MPKGANRFLADRRALLENSGISTALDFRKEAETMSAWSIVHRTFVVERTYPAIKRRWFVAREGRQLD